MHNDQLAGTWSLTGAIAINGEIPFIGEEPKPGAIEEWLYDRSLEQLEQLKPMTGLKLTISNHKTFSEEKLSSLQIPWFDREGVLDNDVTPFGGILKFGESKAYLLLQESIAWATPQGTPAIDRLRYDDGDTKICDSLELYQRKLIRAIAVVTDELYLDKITLRYEQITG